MPALNIIAIQDTVRNSGFSPSSPSGIRPYRLKARNSAKMTKPVAASTKPQPVLVTSQSSAPLAKELSESVARAPQATRANMIAAVTPKTIQSVLGRSVNSGCPGSSVGWLEDPEPPFP